MGSFGGWGGEQHFIRFVYFILKGKGKVRRGNKETKKRRRGNTVKGEVGSQDLSSNSTRQPDLARARAPRTNERTNETKRNDFPVGLTPSTSNFAIRILALLVQHKKLLKSQVLGDGAGGAAPAALKRPLGLGAAGAAAFRDGATGIAAAANAATPGVSASAAAAATTDGASAGATTVGASAALSAGAAAAAAGITGAAAAAAEAAGAAGAAVAAATLPSIFRFARFTIDFVVLAKGKTQQI